MADCHPSEAVGAEGVSVSIVDAVDATAPADLEAAFGTGLAMVDTLDGQLAELLALRSPSERLSDEQLAQRAVEHIARAGRTRRTYGSWAYQPWAHRAVRALPAAEFVEVRTGRNRHKLLDDEQAALRSKRIGVVGLSVGAASAVTLALEGVGGSFRLADPDTLSLSNLNRLRGGVHDIGTNKAVLAARELLELDPYLEVEVYPGGVDAAALDAFLLDGGALDLVVEECDDLYMKVRIRERARELGIPVIMDTSERGMLDVERFDLEPDRELLHGRLGPRSSDDVRDLDPAARFALIAGIIGTELAPRTAMSLAEIGHTLETWPQLASSVALGGALVTHAARQVLLGATTCSGRFIIDLDVLLADEAAHAPTPDALESRTPPLASEMRQALEHAIQAPSGGNAQPWRFVVDDDSVTIGVAASARETGTDPGGLGAAVAVGAAIENAVLSLSAEGHGARLELDDRGGTAMGRITPLPGRIAADPLARWIPHRVTNRRAGDGRPLTGADREALLGSLSDEQARLQLIEDRGRIAAIGALVAGGDRMRFRSPALHGELLAELRWTDDELLAGDGLDVATLELDDTGRAFLELMARPGVADAFDAVEGSGQALTAPAQASFEACSAVALVTYPGRSPLAHLRGGRAMQRMWLTATALGLGVYPHSALSYMFGHLHAPPSPPISRTHELEELKALQADYRRLLDTDPARDAQILLACITHAPPPRARSQRRPLHRAFGPDSTQGAPHGND